MKKDDLVKVIRAIVKQELKKELPKALTQVFQNLMNETPPKQSNTVSNDLPVKDVNETADLKNQLKEMFNGNVPIPREQPRQQPPQKKFTNNPILNEVLNETRPFNGQERMAMGVGGNSIPPSVAMAAEAYDTPSSPTTGVGELMSKEDLGFMDKIPAMPGADSPVVTELPPSGTPLTEGQEGGPAPLEALGEVSALDLKNHPAIPDNIKGILNRDYRSLVKAMDKGKK